ncbi:hypothetical protein BDZ45DRAFT_121254 [Acephala macrosclerotiorum]|nr:hypothetical protein BDZ45DRAFT_121254 [Acephala macrosclerotiorum]
MTPSPCRIGRIANPKRRGVALGLLDIFKGLSDDEILDVLSGNDWDLNRAIDHVFKQTAADEERKKAKEQIAESPSAQSHKKQTRPLGISLASPELASKFAATKLGSFSFSSARRASHSNDRISPARSYSPPGPPRAGSEAANRLFLLGIPDADAAAACDDELVTAEDIEDMTSSNDEEDDETGLGKTNSKPRGRASGRKGGGEMTDTSMFRQDGIAEANSECLQSLASDAPD